MIREWLLKHRWANEIGKLVIGVCFLLVAHQGVISADNIIMDWHNLGQWLGVLFLASIAAAGVMILVDALFSIALLFIRKNKTKNEESNEKTT